MAPGIRYTVGTDRVAPARLTRLDLLCAEGDSNPVRMARKHQRPRGLAAIPQGSGSPSSVLIRAGRPESCESWQRFATGDTGAAQTSSALVPHGLTQRMPPARRGVLEHAVDLSATSMTPLSPLGSPSLVTSRAGCRAVRSGAARSPRRRAHPRAGFRRSSASRNRRPDPAFQAAAGRAPSS